MVAARMEMGLKRLLDQGKRVVVYTLGDLKTVGFEGFVMLFNDATFECQSK